MTCCKCCCGNVNCTEGQVGKCCCGGIYGECCQEDEYCCSGVCQPGPCCDGACDDDSDCPDGCVCVGGECVAAGYCCYKSVAGSYSFSINSSSGTVTNGMWLSSPSFLTLYCTTGVVNCGVTQGDGLFLEYYDGTHTWHGYEAGNAFTYPCASSVTLPGTYTMKNCTTAATATLTIT